MSSVQQNRTIGYALHVSAVVGGIMLLGAALYIHDSLGWRISPLVLFLAVAGLAVFFWSWGTRHLQPLADEVLTSDKRPPILYLRSFANEGSVSAAERAFADMFASIGPFVAIGAPGEKLPPLGAARLYVEDDSWKTKVRELLGMSKLVLIHGGATKGLGWELGQVRRTAHPSRITIMIPNDKTVYEGFRKIAQQAAGFKLPPFPGRQDLKYATPGLAGFIYFDAHWRPSLKPLTRQANRGLGLPGDAATESGRAWGALADIYRAAGLNVAEPPRNWTDTVMNAMIWIGLILLLPFAIAFGLWAIGALGFDPQTGPHWIGF